MKKRYFFLIALMAGLINLYSQDDRKTLEDYITTRTTDQTGKEIIGVIVPGIPPEHHREPVANPSRSSISLVNVPAFSWCFGCSATAAAMAAGYYDNCGYANMYAGPTNGGVMPMNNSSWGTVVINGETLAQCPLSATRNGVDGRTTLGHVDDYWVQTNHATDPYITGGWTQHTYGDCTGDYMGTNQSAFGNIDGGTTFFYYPDGSPLNNYTGSEPGQVDGCHGLRDFYVSRGYTVIQNYTQLIYGYNGNTIGFTFNQYKSEIDAGRPVLIQVEGHTMLGYGYDDATNTVYLHDTWDYNNHSMTWGGSYANMDHYAVTVVQLQAVTFGPVADFIASNLTPQINSTVNLTDLSSGSPAINSWSWSISPSTHNYVGGTSSTTRHPMVQFTAGGYYTITLIVSNGTSNDTVTRTNYIQAIDCSDIPFPFTEDFSDGALPPCWTMIDHIGNGQVWQFNNPGNRTINTYTAGNGFAMLDSDFYGSGNSQNCDLVTPMLDFSDAPGIILTFQHYFRQYSASIATFSYSTNGGTTWTTLQSWTASTTNGAVYSQDLSAQLAGQDSVKFKWNFTGSFEYYWAVDDIEINSEVPGLWTGTTSTDWNVASNWADGNVPGSTLDIEVHPDATNWPVFNGDLTVGTSCGNITLRSGAQMTINGDINIPQGKCLVFNGTGQLNITGDWNNLGTFVPGTGTVVFSGNSPSNLYSDNMPCNTVDDYTAGTFTVGMTSASSTILGPQNDNEFMDVPLGFNFKYMGVVYDSVEITTNGYISFQLAGVANPNNDFLFTTAVPNTAVAPWWDDLRDDGTSTVRYKTEGSEPSRVFICQWWRVLTYSSSALARIKFQVKLYESSGIIEFHYGVPEGGTHSASESASIGLEDGTGGTGHFIEATTGSTTTGITTLKQSDNWPTVNYRFTPVLVDAGFHNLVISKNGAPLNINCNVSLAGELTINPGAGFNISEGKSFKINGTGN